MLGLSTDFALAFVFTHTKVLVLAHAINEVLLGQIPRYYNSDKAKSEIDTCVLKIRQRLSEYLGSKNCILNNCYD